jgi:hypothetical protein
VIAERFCSDCWISGVTKPARDVAGDCILAIGVMVGAPVGGSLWRGVVAAPMSIASMDFNREVRRARRLQ